jgi:plastocyanin
MSRMPGVSWRSVRGRPLEFAVIHRLGCQIGCQADSSAAMTVRTFNNNMGGSPEMTTRIARIVGLLAVAALLVAACGDDGDETTQSTRGVEVTPTGDDPDETTLSPSGVEVTLSVTATDFAFDPVDPVVEVGESSTVHLINKGSLPHTWVVLRQGASAEQYIESLVAATTTDERRDVEEDQTLVKVGPALLTTGDPVTFTIQEAGTYQVICDLPPHFKDGMEGTLVVE